MSELLNTLRAIVRDELGRVRPPELATVTQLHTRDVDTNANHEVSVKLIASGVELDHVPVAVGRLGFSALPNEGDVVILTFVGGNLQAPVALGCLYDDQAHPPMASPQEVVYQPPDDQASGVRRFHFELPSGSTITLDDDALTLTFGSTTAVVNRDGDVLIQSNGKIRLESQGDLELDAQGDVTIQAGGNLTLKGMSVSAEGQTDAKLKGSQVALVGMTQFSPS
jgi:uncharacterized protein involved in type VI secretion and phage assembly